MYFHPPTLDLGPAAAWIGLALLAYHVFAPPLTRPWNSRFQELLLADERAKAHRMALRLAGWCVLAEVLLVMAFVGTAVAVTPADIGLAPPTFADRGSPGLVLLAAGLAAGFAYFLAALVRANLRVLRYLRSGVVPAGTDRDQFLLLPRDLREHRARALVFALNVFSQVLVVYVVLFPLLATLTEPMLAVVVLGLLGGWQYVGHGGGQILVMSCLTALGLFLYATVLPGSLLVPLLVWGSYGAVALGAERAMTGMPVPRVSRPLPPLEVTVLDADGNPVERPGR
ncbi:hypothetical protein ACWFMI_15905 [Nocardiopsis terrae]